MCILLKVCKNVWKTVMDKIVKDRRNIIYKKINKIKSIQQN